jgi:hypothetical protein
MPSDSAADNPFQHGVSARVDAATLSHHRLYRVLLSPYTAFEGNLKLRCIVPIALHSAVVIFLLLAPRPGVAHSQDAAQKPEEKPANKQAEKPPDAEATENPAQIELLETRMRFENDGAGRKEVHTRVKINNELGARQFARLNFEYNRAFESIDVPLARITHASGGTAEILPSAITDQPNLAVVNAPAYQDVRVKTVRILGLEPGDLLEYRVITTVFHHPLAPDFWLDHSFDRTGVVSEEIFEIDLPVNRVDIHINPLTPATWTEKSGEGDAARAIYRWQSPAFPGQGATSKGSKKSHGDSEPDVALSTFGKWERLSMKLAEKLTPGAAPMEEIRRREERSKELAGKPEVTPEVRAKAFELTKSAHSNAEKLEAIYDFVSQKIATIDLPLGASGFAARSSSETLSSGYATQEDKFVLFAALSSSLKLGATAALTGYCDAKGVPRPSVFDHLVVWSSDGKTRFWLDPGLEVAPFGVLSPSAKNCAFVLERVFYGMNPTRHEWEPLHAHPLFAASQRVSVDATLAADGSLTAKVHYTMRGENELLLRLAFHQSPREKWKDVAQLLSLSDGFRGQVSNVTASDPYATKEPFTVEYEISQAKFVDWSKKPVRIPAVLPLVGLPDPPAKTAPGTAASPIDLGTPLDVEAHFTLHLPSGTSATAPTGTSVQRDYATFSSSYSAQAATITGSRHTKFLLREVLATRAADYNAFLRAVRNDETQDFTLERAETGSPKTDLAAPHKAAPPKQNPPKP